MKTIHTFRVVDEIEYGSNRVFPETDMKISSEASLEEMIEAFERFLQSIGYFLPVNSYLDFVSETQPTNDKYEGEF